MRENIRSKLCADDVIVYNVVVCSGSFIKKFKAQSTLGWKRRCLDFGAFFE
jgi:hypothetical protein